MPQFFLVKAYPIVIFSMIWFFVFPRVFLRRAALSSEASEKSKERRSLRISPVQQVKVIRQKILPL